MNHRAMPSGYQGPIGRGKRGRLGPRGAARAGERRHWVGEPGIRIFFLGALGAVTRLRWVPGVWEVGRGGSGCRTFVLEVWQHEGRENQAARLLT